MRCSLLKIAGVLTAFLWVASAKSQSWDWAKKAGGTGEDFGQDIAIDGLGNVYVTGYYGEYSTAGTATFGSTTLNSAGKSDIFIAKYDASGNLLWARSAGGTNNDYSYGIAIDGLGNAYIAGYFGYNPGPPSVSTATFGTTTLTSAGRSDVFIAKYAPSGNLLWAKRAGGTSNDYGNGVAVDGLGNAYILGSFGNDLVSPMVGTATFDTTILTSAGSSDMFLAKYDSLGHVLWAKSGGGNGSDEGKAIDIDGSGNPYITGTFGFTGTSTIGTATFGSSTLTSAGGYDIFVAKYDTLGNVLWAERSGGTSIEKVQDIAIDGSGHAYITGYFNGKTSFGLDTLISVNYEDIFLAKFNSSGNVVWAKSGGGSGYDYCRALAIDDSGNVFVTGHFNEYGSIGGTASFGSTTLTSQGIADIFVVKYDPSGNALWAYRAGGSDDDFGYALAVDSTSKVFVLGTFGYTSGPIGGTTTFGSNTLTNVGWSDIFVAKLSPTTCIPPSITTQPTALTRCIGAPATFTVGATGTGLGYQWKKDNSNILNANLPYYIIPNVSAYDVASYSVVVTGTCGSVTSNTVNLTTNPNTVITAQPSALKKCAGESATFAVAATGIGLSYQWRKGTSDIMGATSSSYTISSVTATDNASYSVDVIGTCGSVNSNSVALLVTIADTSVSVSGSVLTSNEDSASFYKWMNCQSGDTVGNSKSFTATTSGNYKVIITKGTCVSVSGCKNVIGTGLNSRKSSRLISVIPNPTSGQFTIETGSPQPTRVTLFDLHGQIVFNSNVTEKQTVNLSHLLSGIYILQSASANGVATDKLIITK